MIQRHRARLLLAGCCLLLLKLTACPSPTRPDPRPVTPASQPPGGNGLPNATTPAAPPPEPTPPVGVAARTQCPLDAAGRTCYVTQTDDGSAPPTAHPCQHAQVGQCDPGGQPTCLFRWKLDGEACNGGLGVCQSHRCRCTSDRSCGYDCSQTCDAGSSCQQGTCVAGNNGNNNGNGNTGNSQPCGGCAHRAC